jgi:hypothetical protein
MWATSAGMLAASLDAPFHALQIVEDGRTKDYTFRGDLWIWQ